MSDVEGGRVTYRTLDEQAGRLSEAEERFVVGWTLPGVPG
jgi:hypothetical protein